MDTYTAVAPKLIASRSNQKFRLGAFYLLDIIEAEQKRGVSIFSRLIPNCSTSSTLARMRLYNMVVPKPMDSSQFLMHERAYCLVWSHLGNPLLLRVILHDPFY